MTLMVIRPEISMSVPAAGSQSRRNLRLGRSAAVGICVRRGPATGNRAVHGDPASFALHRRQLRDREHREDDEIRGVRAQDVGGGGSLGRVVLAARGPGEKGSGGVQTWRSATIAAMPEIEATMSVSSIESRWGGELGGGEGESADRRHGPCLPDSTAAVDHADEDERERSGPATASGVRRSRRARPCRAR